MGVDVDRVLAQYESATTDQPMHGKPGEVRRNPSTDQKKARRRQQEAKLLRTAATTTDAAEQRQALAEVEQLRTEAMREEDEARSLDITSARINDTMVPGHVHELHTVGTDWLLDIPAHTASQGEAEQKLIVEAINWYGRVDPMVKADGAEFTEQARNKARYVASQYGDHSEVAAQAFLVESGRLRGQDIKMGRLLSDDSATGMTHTASVQRQALQAHDLDNLDDEGMIDRPDLDDPGPADEGEPATEEHKPFVVQHPEAKPGGSGVHPIHDLMNHMDSGGVREMGQQHAQHMLGRLGGQTFGVGPDPTYAYAEHLVARSASLSREPDRFPEGLIATAAAGPPLSYQDGTQNLPTPPSYEVDTASNRAPALQEMDGYTGWGGTSVVPNWDGGAEEMNGQSFEDHLDGAYPPKGFPVSGNRQTANNTKESAMTDHAQCPTCGGLGKVAVRRLAYSGLPQVDQIVSADETPNETPLPPEVAFPLVWDPNQVNRTIQEAEQQIATRPTGLPGPPGGPGSRGASRRTANGQDNSGWMGDMGAKGLDYPGYSAPIGYDGGSNLGEPDPVYGFGGDQAPGPKKPYGAAEADDFTNNPGEDPTRPVCRTTTTRAGGKTAPGMTTSGSRDPFVAAAQEEIARQQQLIRTRSAMLARQSR